MRVTRLNCWLYGFVFLFVLSIRICATGNALSTEDMGFAFSEYFVEATEPPHAQINDQSTAGQDKNYIIGPGDVFDIMVWGKLQSLYTVEVSWDGTLMPVSENLSNVEGFLKFWPGSVSVENLTLANFQKMINESFSKYLKENVQVNVKVVKTHKISVQILGKVDKPHEYIFESGATLVDAISAAGYTPQTSLRRIRLVRRGTKGADQRFDSILDIDLYQFFVDYDMDTNVVLQNGDLIQVPNVELTATISGGVNLPAKYEILPGERLSDLVHFSHGLVWSAEPTQSFLQRRINSVNLEGFQINLSFISTGILDSPENLILQNRDALIVGQNSDFQSFVKVVFDNLIAEKQDVVGFQEHQKTVSLADGRTLTQLFSLFQNMLMNADLSNITLLRNGKKIRIDYLGVLNAPEMDLVLQGGDIIYVPKSIEYVYVLGEVNTPTMIKFGRDSSILEYIAQAGGYLPTAKLAIVTLLHTGTSQQNLERIDLKNWIKTGIKPQFGDIMPGDIIIVPKESAFVFKDYVSIFNSVLSSISILKLSSD